MRGILAQVAVCVALVFCVNAQGQMVKIYKSTLGQETAGSSGQPIYFGGPGAGTASVTVMVNDNDRYQRIDRLMSSPHCHSQSSPTAHASPTMGQSQCDAGQSQQDKEKSLAKEARRVLFEPLREGARSVLVWNQELGPDESASSNQCGPCKNMLTIDDQTSSDGSSLDYALLLHVSDFVVHNARRIASDASALGTLDDVAFRNPDGSIVLVTANSGSTALAFNVDWSGRMFTYEQAAGSVVTFTWKPKAMFVSLEPSRTALSILPGESASLKLNVWPMENGVPGVSLRCEGAPPMSACDVTPERVAFKPPEHPTAKISISTTAPQKKSGRLKGEAGLLASCAFLSVLPIGYLVTTRRKTRSRVASCLLCLSICLCLPALSCGDNIDDPAAGGTPPGTYQLTIIATPDVGPLTQIAIPLEIRSR